MTGEKRLNAVGNVADDELTGRGRVGGCEGRLLWIERERRARLRRKFKDGWAEGSAGLRVTTKQEQTFYQRRQIAASERSVPGQPIFVLHSSKWTAVGFGSARVFRTLVGLNSLSGTGPSLESPPSVQASSENFTS